MLGSELPARNTHTDRCFFWQHKHSHCECKLDKSLQISTIHLNPTHLSALSFAARSRAASLSAFALILLAWISYFGLLYGSTYSTSSCNVAHTRRQPTEEIGWKYQTYLPKLNFTQLARGFFSSWCLGEGQQIQVYSIIFYCTKSKLKQHAALLHLLGFSDQMLSDQTERVGRVVSSNAC